MPTGPNTPYTNLDMNQILQRSFEENDDRLRVHAEVTATLGTVECVIDAGSGDNISISSADGSKRVTLTTLGSQNGLDNFLINPKDYGTASLALRTASQIGNSTGEASFDAGTTGIQTLRVTSNITRNGTELDYDIGTPGVNTLRVASILANSTGQIDYNAGTSSAQTVRTSSNITRNGTELSYNIAAPDANTLRTAAILANTTGQVDYNHGTVGTQTQRVVAVLSNETDKADFNGGVTGAQTIRATVNLSDGNANKVTSSTINSNTLLHVQTPDTTTTPIALGALNASISVSMEGLPGIGFKLAVGTFIGTLSAESSLDGGSTWAQSVFYDPANFSVITSITFTSANGLKNYSIIPLSGASHVRVRVSAYTSGTADGLLRATTVSGATGAITAAAFSAVTNSFLTVGIAADLILAANVNRKYACISNNGASSIKIQFSTATGLTASRGINIPINGIFEIKGDSLFTGNIYAISTASSNITVIEGVPQ